MKFLVIAILAIALGFGATHITISKWNGQEAAVVPPSSQVVTEPALDVAPDPEPENLLLPPENGKINNAGVKVSFFGTTPEKQIIGSFESILPNFQLITGTLVGSVTIDTNSVTATDAGVVGLLKGASFLNVAKFPTANFSVVSWKKAADGTFTVSGKLVVRGITKTISFPVTYENRAYRADIPVNLSDYGVTTPLIEKQMQLQIIVPLE